MSQKEPRSVRLTKAHREDMLKAVMDEWVKQNPQPTSPNASFHRVVVDQVKAHPSYKTTQRLLAAVKGEDRAYLRMKRSTVRVVIQDSEGGARNTVALHYPVPLATELGLYLTGNPSVRLGYMGAAEYGEPGSIANMRGCHGELTRGLTVRDIVGDDPATDSDGDAPVLVWAYAGDNDITVTLDDSCQAYREYKAQLLAANEWRKDYERLRQETADILEQFNTTKQIREGWPDMVPYMPPHIADPEGVVRLPVLAVDRLSERLGIKS